MRAIVRLHPLAVAEAVDTQLWYEEHAGLGDDFVTQFEAAVDRAARRPGLGSPVRLDTHGEILERRVKLARYPYVVVYRAARLGIEILAVHHERRRPLYWTDR